MVEFSLVTRQPPRDRIGSSAMLQARSLAASASRAAHQLRVLGMQMHAHVARIGRQQRHRLADHGDDLVGMQLELAPHHLARDRAGEQRQLPLHLLVELGDRLAP